MKKILLLVLILSSCAPVYIPNSRNSPMFQKGGEFQGSVSFGNGIEAQTAVSLTNHFGIMANYLYLNQNAADNNNAEDYRHHEFFEGGIGYFENQEKMFFEIFAGYGSGKGSGKNGFTISSQTLYAEGKYNRYFLQPAFGFNKKSMHISFVPRFSMVDFTEFTESGISYPIDEQPVFFIEPAFIGRVNFANNRIFFTFQTGFSVPVNSNRYFDYRAFQMSGGLGFRLGGFRSDENSK